MIDFCSKPDRVGVVARSDSARPNHMKVLLAPKPVMPLVTSPCIPFDTLQETGWHLSNTEFASHKAIRSSWQS